MPRARPASSAAPSKRLASPLATVALRGRDEIDAEVVAVVDRRHHACRLAVRTRAIDAHSQIRPRFGNGGGVTGAAGVTVGLVVQPAELARTSPESSHSRPPDSGRELAEVERHRGGLAVEDVAPAFEEFDRPAVRLRRPHCPRRDPGLLVGGRRARRTPPRATPRPRIATEFGIDRSGRGRHDRRRDPRRSKSNGALACGAEPAEVDRAGRASGSRRGSLTASARCVIPSAIPTIARSTRSSATIRSFSSARIATRASRSASASGRRDRSRRRGRCRAGSGRPAAVRASASS